MDHKILIKMIFSAHQPQFFSYIGYFSKIQNCNHFILLDNVQFKKNEFQNRNRIKTHSGIQWLTIPVLHSSRQRISDILINNRISWRRKHIQTFRTYYSKASFYIEVMALLEKLYSKEWEYLNDFNSESVRLVCNYLGITTPINIGSAFEPLTDDPDLRLIEIARKIGADRYLAGSGGREYMNMDKWKVSGVDVTFQEIILKEYPQLYGDFIPGLSILDALFNLGKETKEFL